jgi:hypothetical protein
MSIRGGGNFGIVTLFELWLHPVTVRNDLQPRTAMW